MWACHDACGHVVSNGFSAGFKEEVEVEEEEEEKGKEEEEEEEGESELEGMAPSLKRCKLGRETALKVSLLSWLYHVFRGLEGPTHNINPCNSNALDYFLLLWPASLSELIALETNIALQRGIAKC